MVLNDPIYGKEKIKEAVLLELLKSPALLRLKNISQYGVPDKYYHLQNLSRYEHSIGVMILVRRLGGTLEEQVAGLIHDLSHYAFSHVADWVFSEGNRGNEELQNSLMEEFVKDGQTTKILTKYGFSVDRLLDEKNFTLLERKIPDLCADRIDYALREFKYWLNPEIVKKCVKGLTNYNGEIVFSSQETAFLFASNFLKLQEKHWGGFEAVIRYHLFSKALKTALEEKIINKADFYQDEPFILAKVESCHNKEIENALAILKKKDLLCYKKASGTKVFKKFRHVDPKVIANGELVKLSKFSSRFTKLLEKQRKINEAGVFV